MAPDDPLHPDRPTGEIELGEFEPASYADWRRLVEEKLGEGGVASLRSETRGGVEIEPLYAESLEDVPQPPDPAGFPGLPPYARGVRPGGHAEGAWRVAQEYSGPAVEETAAAVEADVGRGVDLVWLRLGGAFGGEGVAVADVSDLERLLEAVDPARVEVVLEAGAEGMAAAALLADWAERRGVDLGELGGAVGCDPLGALARDGELRTSLDAAFQELADLARWCRKRAPRLRSVLVSTVPYHDAGAAPTDELALGLATGVEYLRRLEAGGLGIEEAAGRMLFAVAAGSDVFLEIAKLRAARLLWAKVVAACGGGAEAQAMRLHVRTSAVETAALDHRLNLLRSGAAGFAAAVAGAASLATEPIDEPLGAPLSRRRRHAISAQHVLEEEAHLGRVADPAGGSFYLEALTEKLARAAWERFREIERSGGMARALLSGAVAGRLRAAADELRRAVADRRRPIVGVSRFADLREEVPAPRPAAITKRLAPREAPRETVQEPARAEPLERLRLARPFEELRAAAEGHGARTGERPRVFLALLDPPAVVGPRRDFVADLLAAGGVETVDGEPYESAEAAAEAFARSGARAAAVCATDERLRALGAEAARALLSAGAKRVWIAGRPGDWADGLDGDRVVFVHRGGDALDALRDLHTALEVES